MDTVDSIELLSDVEPTAALARFVDIATPVLAKAGFELEGQGNDWAHWTRVDFRNVIRAYAFRHEGEEGVSFYGRGEVPRSVLESLADDVVTLTGWRRKDDDPST
jgi:hypothetical protein